LVELGCYASNKMVSGRDSTAEPGTMLETVVSSKLDELWTKSN